MSHPTQLPLHESSLDDGTELITGEAVALDVRPTGFILRAAGAIIDYIVSIAVFIGLMLVMFSWALSGVQMDTSMFTAIVLGLTVLCLVVLPAAVEIATRGRSLGRLVVGARIVRDDGGAPGFRHAFIRALTGYFEIYLTAGGIAALTGLLSSRSKRLGDVLAGTYSQRERLPRVVEPVAMIPPQLGAWSVGADVARLPDALARRVTQFLKQAGAMTPATRARLAAELAAEVSQFVSPLPVAPPEMFLVGVSVIRREREYQAQLAQRQRLALLQPTLAGQPHHFPDR
ncbi:MAG TPA: RDD family protein [Plantibacter sp.]|uniref:RDD family protein n=1 Tax=unclassified Plantibacter TaxID=2624265 RepID=UPI002CA491F5|nr:RDD family protein [Plantibacter sp.]